MEKAITVGVNINNNPHFNYSMEELNNLAGACDIEIVQTMSQNLESENATHYIGIGKAEEIAEIIKEKQIDTVIFNDELSPSQIRNLEDILDTKVIDRTYLILEIFSRRAQTKEAKLQVEIAQLKYMMPRLIGLRASLSRQYGGGTGGTVNRGSGEKKLELDRRKIEKRIALCNKELNELVAVRQNQRKQRAKNGIPIVAIVGYTNSGKSTLLNSFLETYSAQENKFVLERDMLFATLETSARRIKLPNNKEFLLIDTVGFVSNLPHYLIKAFRSTLEEVKEADLLLHVVDITNPHLTEQKDITHQVLKEIGVEESVPEIIVYNKTDLPDIQNHLASDNELYISAKSKKGLPELTEKIEKMLFQDYKKCEFLFPFTQGNLEQYFRENSHVYDVAYLENGIKMTVECKGKDAEKYCEYLV
ncbi:MAG: GTPase HflX [Clostridia bacterium]|nr:GTPase HflX [Clostridia bacterium]